MTVMITSKLTSKAQTTIPRPVRNALRLVEGDESAYIIDGDRVILTKATREAADDTFATIGGATCTLTASSRRCGTSSRSPFPIPIGRSGKIGPPW